MKVENGIKNLPYLFSISQETEIHYEKNVLSTIDKT